MPARQPQMSGNSERFAWGRWILLALVLFAGIPPLIVIGWNSGQPKLPDVSDECKAVAGVPGLADQKPIGNLKPEGIRLLRDMIASGRPARNPLTIVQTYWKHRHSTIMKFDPKEGKLVPNFSADAWALLMVPVPGEADKFDTYHYFQDGQLAYLTGPDGGEQVLIMPFEPEEFHAKLAPYGGRPVAFPAQSASGPASTDDP